MNTYNEKEIIALLQDPARQKEAFECIVNEYSEQLYWQIRRMVLSHIIKVVLFPNPVNI